MSTKQVPTCWTRGPLRMLDEGERRGYPRERLVAALGASASRVADPDARVPLDAYYALVEAVAAFAREPWFGLTYAASRRPIDGLDAVGFLAMSSRTLGEAITRVIRYQAFLRSGERYALDVEGGDAVFRFRAWGPVRAAHAHVAMIAAFDFLSAARVLTGVAVEPSYCRFRFAVEGPIDQAAQILGVRPELSASEDAWAVPRGALSLPISRADPLLARFFEDYLEKRTRADEPSFRAEVERRLSDRLAEGDLSLRATARALSVSVRTLQRRLAAEGTAFEAVLDDVRRRRALALLRAGLARLEVASLVGYEDGSAFARAVRRWSGTTPSAWVAAEEARRSRPPRA
jgi:AraC-like DNA-binding protein